MVDDVLLQFNDDSQNKQFKLESQFEVIEYFSGLLAALVILLYDHLLTFGDEVYLVWKAKFSVSKCLFLFNRYMVPFLIIVHVVDQSGLFFMSSNEFCKIYFTASLYLGMTTVGVSNFLILLRLWVLWEHNIRLMGLTLVFFGTAEAVSIALVSITAVNMIPSLSVNPLKNTCNVGVQFKIGFLFVPQIIFEIMVFLTTSLNALERPRKADDNITYQLYRDGAAYFLIMFFLHVTNIVLASTASVNVMILGIYVIWSMSNITLNRLVLHTRNHRRQFSWEIPTSAKDDDDDDEYEMEEKAHILESIDPEKMRTSSSMGFMKPDLVLSAQHPAILKAPNGPPIVILPNYCLNGIPDNNIPYKISGFGWFEDGGQLRKAP